MERKRGSIEAIPVTIMTEMAKVTNPSDKSGEGERLPEINSIKVMHCLTAIREMAIPINIQAVCV
jgi:hypothetical protein